MPYQYRYLSQSAVEDSCRCAGVLLIRRCKEDGRLQVLLVQSKRKSYAFSFPKGKRNRMECTLTAAQRELYEETGIEPTDYDWIAPKKYIEYRTDTGTPHIVYYLAELTNPNVVLEPKDKREIVDAKWFDPEEIYTMKKSFYLQRRQIVTRAIRDYKYRETVRELFRPCSSKPECSAKVMSVSVPMMT